MKDIIYRENLYEYEKSAKVTIEKISIEYVGQADFRMYSKRNFGSALTSLRDSLSKFFKNTYTQITFHSIFFLVFSIVTFALIKGLK